MNGHAHGVMYGTAVAVAGTEQLTVCLSNYRVRVQRPDLRRPRARIDQQLWKDCEEADEAGEKESDDEVVRRAFWRMDRPVDVTVQVERDSHSAVEPPKSPQPLGRAV